jgi:hypothetical protein
MVATTDHLMVDSMAAKRAVWSAVTSVDLMVYNWDCRLAACLVA